eukprot:1183209-Prorocentrum_minimum.AAC.2
MIASPWAGEPGVLQRRHLEGGGGGDRGAPPRPAEPEEAPLLQQHERGRGRLRHRARARARKHHGGLPHELHPRHGARRPGARAGANPTQTGSTKSNVAMGHSPN